MHLRDLKYIGGQATFLLFLLIISVSTDPKAETTCHGKFVNPITDVCWSCLFPIKIAGFEVVSGGPDTPAPTTLPVCLCPRPGIPVPVPGLPIGFWEPSRLVDVTRTPMCMVSLGGISLGDSFQKGFRDEKDGSAFSHVHWYIYPVLYWLELLLDFACLEASTVDVAFLTEFDPLWGDDAKTSILNPEAFLFGNPIAQGACLADCAASSVGLSSNPLFWCAGCQGGVYPMTGTVSHHMSGLNHSLLLLNRMIFKLHRQLLLWGYMGEAGLCGKYPMPLIKKSQYRYQMTFPVAETSSCKRLGQTEVTWQSGREFPVKGEDFGYLIWRKRDCCLL
jgi:conjugal transfer pilus assembly protein TraU